MNKLSGFAPVYKHSVVTRLKSGKFIALTVIVSLILFLGVAAAVFFIAKPDKEDTSNFEIKKVYVGDKTDFGIPAYNEIAAAYGDDAIAEVEFEVSDDIDKLIKERENEADLVAIVHEKNEDGIVINIVTARDSNVKGSDVRILSDALNNYYKEHIFALSGLSGEELAQMYLGVSYEVEDSTGSVDTEGKLIATILIVMATILICYIMSLSYGQTICADVSMEKTSKLVEQLLISVTPYGLVSGKILGVITVAITQFSIWILSAILGLFGGDLVLKLLYSDYVSQISAVFDAIGKWFGETAANPFVIVFALVFLLSGIVLYLSLAGVAGAMVTRPEETGSMQIVFVFPMLICYFIALFAVIEGEGHVATWYSLVPFMSALIAPSAIILGDVSIMLGIVGFVLNVLCLVAILAFAAKVYKALLFYNGNPLTPVKAFKIIFTKPKNK